VPSMNARLPRWSLSCSRSTTMQDAKENAVRYDVDSRNDLCANREARAASKPNR